MPYRLNAGWSVKAGSARALLIRSGATAPSLTRLQKVVDSSNSSPAANPKPPSSRTAQAVQECSVTRATRAVRSRVLRRSTFRAILTASRRSIAATSAETSGRDIHTFWTVVRERMELEPSSWGVIGVAQRRHVLCHRHQPPKVRRHWPQKDMKRSTGFAAHRAVDTLPACSRAVHGPGWAGVLPIKIG